MAAIFRLDADLDSYYYCIQKIKYKNSYYRTMFDVKVVKTDDGLLHCFHPMDELLKRMKDKALYNLLAKTPVVQLPAYLVSFTVSEEDYAVVFKNIELSPTRFLGRVLCAMRNWAKRGSKHRPKYEFGYAWRLERGTENTCRLHFHMLFYTDMPELILRWLCMRHWTFQDYQALEEAFKKGKAGPWFQACDSSAAVQSYIAKYTAKNKLKQTDAIDRFENRFKTYSFSRQFQNILPCVQVAYDENNLSGVKKNFLRKKKGWMKFPQAFRDFEKYFLWEPSGVRDYIERNVPYYHHPTLAFYEIYRPCVWEGVEYWYKPGVFDSNTRMTLRHQKDEKFAKTKIKQHFLSEIDEEGFNRCMNLSYNFYWERQILKKTADISLNRDHFEKHKKNVYEWRCCKTRQRRSFLKHSISPKVPVMRIPSNYHAYLRNSWRVLELNSVDQCKVMSQDICVEKQFNESLVYNVPNGFRLVFLPPFKDIRHYVKPKKTKKYAQCDEEDQCNLSMVDMVDYSDKDYQKLFWEVGTDEIPNFAYAT